MEAWLSVSPSTPTPRLELLAHLAVERTVRAVSGPCQGGAAAPEGVEGRLRRAPNRRSAAGGGLGHQHELAVLDLRDAAGAVRAGTSHVRDVGVDLDDRPLDGGSAGPGEGAIPVARERLDVARLDWLDGPVRRTAPHQEQDHERRRQHAGTGTNEVHHLLLHWCRASRPNTFRARPPDDNRIFGLES